MEGLGTTSPLNDYAYNGKELNEDFGLNLSDYGARWYDAALGRWWSVDPLANKYNRWSSYCYTFDNPLRYIDPNGMAVSESSGKITLTGEHVQAFLKLLNSSLGTGDPEKTKTAATNAVNYVVGTDVDGKQPAKCNKGVNYAFNELTGSQELADMRANQMVDYMKNSPNFSEVPISETQSLANAGEIVIAGYQSPDYIANQGLPESERVKDSDISSGHVALVVPGTAKTEGGTWNGSNLKSLEGGIPNLMDTGAGMRTESQPANKSFGKGKHNDVHFFLYTGGATPEQAINQSSPIPLEQVIITAKRIFMGQHIINFKATDRNK